MKVCGSGGEYDVNTTTNLVTLTQSYNASERIDSGCKGVVWQFGYHIKLSHAHRGNEDSLEGDKGPDAMEYNECYCKCKCNDLSPPGPLSHR